MTDTLKIFVPMAGWGTRMRPHTWSKPKPLVTVAGKTSLEHLLDMFASLPEPANTEYIFIVGPYLGETQIPPFIKEHYPALTARYVLQTEMKGQSHALWLAREYMHGPMIMCFSDTLMETDFSFLAQEQADGVAWVMPVPDPRRFGVAELDGDGWVKRFIEKPQTPENNLAVVGCYYLKDSAALLAAIEKQMQRGVALKDEFFLTDAISIMIEDGAQVKTQTVASWLDTGTIEATLDTNKTLLGKSGSQVGDFKRSNVKIVEPVAVADSADITDSTIGPFVSIGPHCRVHNSRIQDSIIEEWSEIRDAVLERSLIGAQALVQGRGDGQVLRLNVGDDSSVLFERD